MCMYVLVLSEIRGQPAAAISLLLHVVSGDWAESLYFVYFVASALTLRAISKTQFCLFLISHIEIKGICQCSSIFWRKIWKKKTLSNLRWLQFMGPCFIICFCRRFDQLWLQPVSILCGLLWILRSVSGPCQEGAHHLLASSIHYNLSFNRFCRKYWPRLSNIRCLGDTRDYSVSSSFLPSLPSNTLLSVWICDTIGFWVRGLKKVELDRAILESEIKQGSHTFLSFQNNWF